jgi:hypothetical protein
MRPTPYLKWDTDRVIFQAVSSVAPPQEQLAISDAEPLFKKLSDAELYVFASDNLPIGVRIGLKGVAEPTLKALANFEQERRKGEREVRSRRVERLWWMFGLVATAGLSVLFTWLAR